LVHTCPNKKKFPGSYTQTYRWFFEFILLVKKIRESTVISKIKNLTLTPVCTYPETYPPVLSSKRRELTNTGNYILISKIWNGNLTSSRFQQFALHLFVPSKGLKTSQLDIWNGSHN
jgi:hypothetical protein